MLTSLQIKNFKAWRDTGQVKFAPLTVIFGANSAGKSSLGHLLLALKQTATSSDRRRALHLGDDNSLIDLGTFRECINTHDMTRALSFELSWRLSKPLEVRDPVTLEKYAGDTISLAASLKARERTEQVYVDDLEYNLSADGVRELSASFGRRDNKLTLETSPIKLIRQTGRPWPLEEPDKFYRISDQSRARFQNADFLADFALETEAVLNNIYYLAATHSIKYESLVDFFISFDIYDTSSNEFFSVKKRNEFATENGLTVPPLIFDGKIGLSEIQLLLSKTKSAYGDVPAEGLILRQDTSERNTFRAKIVRPEFTQAIEEHWSRKYIKWNTLK